MAIQQNGQPANPLVFVDNKPGTRIFVGETAPVGMVEGDIWLDSDVFNNAGKNLISVNSLTTGSTFNIPVVTDSYKDLYIVFRGVNVSANASLYINVNNNNTNYTNGSNLFTISNIKSATTTNHWTVEIPDFKANAVFSFACLKGVYTNSSNSTAILYSHNGFTLVDNISSVQLSLSTGTFTSGSVLLYGVN